MPRNSSFSYTDLLSRCHWSHEAPRFRKWPPLGSRVFCHLFHDQPLMAIWWSRRLLGKAHRPAVAAAHLNAILYASFHFTAITTINTCQMPNETKGNWDESPTAGIKRTVALSATTKHQLNSKSVIISN